MKTSLNFILASLFAAIAAVALSGCATKSNSTDESAPAAVVEAAGPDVASGAPAATTSRITLTVVKVDSEETVGEDGKGTNAVDGNPDTIWHTQWQDANPECPHEIIIKLTPPALIKGFTYLPRQDESDHGTIRDYEFYVSNDGTNFGQPVQKGSFENTKDKKTVTFEAEQCQYIKLKALTEANGEAWTSAAEIGVIPSD
jgi:ABC-type oligopeptide transport system substrate-binding subunit